MPQQYQQRYYPGDRLYEEEDKYGNLNLKTAYAKVARENELRLWDAINNNSVNVDRLIKQKHPGEWFIYYENPSPNRIAVFKKIGKYKKISFEVSFEEVYPFEKKEKDTVHDGYSGTIDSNGDVSLSKSYSEVAVKFLELGFQNVKKTYDVYYFITVASNENENASILNKFNDNLTKIKVDEKSNFASKTLGEDFKQIPSAPTNTAALMYFFMLLGCIPFFLMAGLPMMGVKVKTIEYFGLIVLISAGIIFCLQILFSLLFYKQERKLNYYRAFVPQLYYRKDMFFLNVLSLIIIALGAISLLCDVLYKFIDNDAVTKVFATIGIISISVMLGFAVIVFFGYVFSWWSRFRGGMTFFNKMVKEFKSEGGTKKYEAIIRETKKFFKD